MPKKMDGVKISVNNEAENSEKNSAPAKKAAPPKKITRKKKAAKPAKKAVGTTRKKAPAVVRETAKPTPEKKPTAMSAPNAVKPKKGFIKSMISLIVSVVITGLIVGIGIYAWQTDMANKSIDEIKEDARSTRMEFEQRLTNLKNKLQGVEDEKKQLETTNEELKERAELLAGAIKEFESEELGLVIEYPALFGEVVIKTEDGAEGTKFSGTFSKNDKLVFGGVSKDFEPKATTTTFAFSDTEGFIERRGKYYFVPPSDDPQLNFEIMPTKVIDAQDGKALLLDKKSFVVDPEGDGLPVDIGENIGALVNLRSENYTGVAFTNMDFGMMPLESFEEMIASLEVK